MYSQEMLNNLFKAMIDYFESDPKRIQHFVKVHSFAKLIGQLENLDEASLFLLEAAAFVHDIGIKNSEIKYNNCNGKNQEKEGYGESIKILSKLDFPKETVEKIAYIVAHHHSYGNIDINNIELQILIEADFIVNLYEEKLSKKAVISACEKIFKTSSGIYLLKKIFGV